MTKYAEFPIKKKGKIKKIHTSSYGSSIESIKKLDGEFNGWWIYQFCLSDFILRIKPSNPKRRNK